MAMPNDPGLSGSSTGDGTTSLPQVSIIIRRYGFCSYDARTMYTLHWPAPVSVVSRVMPSSLL